MRPADWRNIILNKIDEKLTAAGLDTKIGFSMYVDNMFPPEHIKLNNPTFEELKHWHAVSGLPLKKFFNTSGLLYKSMNLKEKLPTMTGEEQLRLLASDGMLVKRPILVNGDKVLVGFREKEWEQLL
jgi:arsenate reductase